MNDSESKKQAQTLRELLDSLPPISQAELERREQAARNLRASRIHVPWYAEQDRKYGMDFWRQLHSSAVLSDGLNYRQKRRQHGGNK